MSEYERKQLESVVDSLEALVSKVERLVESANTGDYTQRKCPSCDYMGLILKDEGKNYATGLGSRWLDD